MGIIPEVRGERSGVSRQGRILVLRTKPPGQGKFPFREQVRCKFCERFLAFFAGTLSFQKIFQAEEHPTNFGCRYQSSLGDDLFTIQTFNINKALLNIFHYGFSNNFVDGSHAIEDQFQASFAQSCHSLAAGKISHFVDRGI